MTRLLTLPLLLATVGCQVEDDADFSLVDPDAPTQAELDADADLAPPPVPAAQVWETCGDPICSGWVDKGLRDCPTWVTPGMFCPDVLVGRHCDPVDFCNATYTCAYTDPTSGGCPISKREFKQDIAYLDAEARRKLADQLLDYELATYRYKGTGDDGPMRLGFIIDDVTPSPSIAPSGKNVDLYAYTTMAVATLKVQQEQITALQAELATLKAQVAAQ